MDKTYPHLGNLIGAYLNPDFDPKLWEMDARAFVLKVAQVTAEHGSGERRT